MQSIDSWSKMPSRSSAKLYLSLMASRLTTSSVVRSSANHLAERSLDGQRCVDTLQCALQRSPADKGDIVRITDVINVETTSNWNGLFFCSVTERLGQSTCPCAESQIRIVVCPPKLPHSRLLLPVWPCFQTHNVAGATQWGKWRRKHTKHTFMEETCTLRNRPSFIKPSLQSSIGQA